MYGISMGWSHWVVKLIFIIYMLLVIIGNQQIYSKLEFWERKMNVKTYKVGKFALVLLPYLLYAQKYPVDKHYFENLFYIESTIKEIPKLKKIVKIPNNEQRLSNKIIISMILSYLLLILFIVFIIIDKPIIYIYTAVIGSVITLTGKASITKLKTKYENNIRHTIEIKESK